jgi:hypothetical protein
MSGTHWVAARLLHNTLYYADPFGTLLGGYPPTELAVCAKKIITNPITFQRPTTNLCGYWAYLFATAMDAIKAPITRSEFSDLLMRTCVH